MVSFNLPLTNFCFYLTIVKFKQMRVAGTQRMGIGSGFLLSKKRKEVELSYSLVDTVIECSLSMDKALVSMPSIT